MFWTLSFEVVPVSEAALVNSGWASYQILDINLPFLWAWILLPSKVSMWIFLYNLIEIHYSLSPHIICVVWCHEGDKFMIFVRGIHVYKPRK